MKKKTSSKKQLKKSKRSAGPARSECSPKLNCLEDTGENAEIAIIEQKPSRPKKPLNRKSFCIASLRRSSYRWPPRNEALKLANRGRNKYVCATCGEGIIYAKKEIQRDHKEPVVKLTGWDSLDSFAERLLCEVDGFQILCLKHHEEKTFQEKELRKHYRKIMKDE